MKILLIEDDLDLGAALQRSLDQANLPSVWVRRLADGVACLESTHVDCVLPLAFGRSVRLCAPD